MPSNAELTTANEKLTQQLADANELLAAQGAELIALKANGGEINADTSAIITENGQLKERLAELERMLMTRAAKKGALVCVTNIKDNGTPYKMGDVYTGENAKRLLHSGALRLQD